MTTLQEKRRRLFISNSGGKTSAYMTNLLLNGGFGHWPEIAVLFANTGQEHEKTLRYIDACDRQYGFGTVWVESVFDSRMGFGTRHRVVSFASAARNGEPFEEFVKKHGLPNTQFPQCTRELKRNSMRSYLRSIGWEAGSYNTAIGIRADEMDRMSPSSMRDGTFYPLIDLQVSKEDILKWESEQPVRLGIPEHWGNCVWCWKKSLRKLGTVAKEIPEAFDFPLHLESTYRDHGAGFGDRRIFRGRRTVADIVAMAQAPDFKPFVDSFKYYDEELDAGMSCGESCEIGVDGPTEVEP